MSVYVSQLEAKLPNEDRELCLRFAWPFDVWECFIPVNLSPEINVLEKLILSLIDGGITPTESQLLALLCSEIGLIEELISNALETCKAKGYIN